MKSRKWIVIFRFNDIVHSRSFAEYDKALRFYYIQEENGYCPSIHEG